MLHIWATVTTIANTALGVAGLGVAGYAVSAKPPMILFYYGVAFICVFGCIVGFVNMWFLNQAVRQYEEKNRPIREERERKKAERAAKKAEKEAARATKAQEEAAREAAAQAAPEAEPEEPLTDPALPPEDEEPAGGEDSAL